MANQHHSNQRDHPQPNSVERASIPCAPPGSVHLLFGSVEELLADLSASGGPDGGVVRVERLVRSQPGAISGVATFGIAVTARRARELSETLSAWVIVARVALNPAGQAISVTRAQEAARRHHEAHRLLSALVADAGYTPRSGLYLLSDDCYQLSATAESLAIPESGDETSAPGSDVENAGGTPHA